MATGKKPDPRRKKNNAPHSDYLRVECGKTYGAYSAGEVYGCYSHRTHATLPCVANITDDDMRCPYCEAGHVSEWRGWVPLWDSDWRLRHVVIGEEILPSVDAIPFRAKVVAMRAKNPISPLIVRECPTALTRELPAGAPWNQAVPMLAVCLVLWKMPALTRWCEERNLLALGATRKQEAAPAPKMLKPEKAQKPYVAPADAEAPVSQLLAGSLNRIKALEDGGKIVPNGKHKKE